MAFELLRNKKFLYLVILLSVAAVGILINEIFLRAELDQIFEPEMKGTELSIDFDSLEALQEQGFIRPRVIEPVEVPGRLNPFAPY